MAMKKILSTARKHGYAARAQLIARRLCLQLSATDVAEPSQTKPRLKTCLTFESRSQAYLWTTDRGRSRLIKH